VSAPKFNVGGKDYYLKFDYNALADFEESTGQTLDPRPRQASGDPRPVVGSDTQHVR
jgi:hypothetical protein